MRKMILVAMVFLMSHMAMAAGLAKERIETRVKPYADRIEKAKLDKAGDFTKDAKVMKLVTDSLDKIVREAGVGETSSLIKLINNDSGRSALIEIARLSSIIGDKAATAAEVATAKKALELLSLSGKSVELLAKDEAQAKEQQAKVDLALKVSEKIASFNGFESATAKTYAKAYETALENGMSPRDAMKDASLKSKKEIKEEDIESCTI